MLRLFLGAALAVFVPAFLAAPAPAQNPFAAPKPADEKKTPAELEALKVLPPPKNMPRRSISGPRRPVLPPGIKPPVGSRPVETLDTVEKLNRLTGGFTDPETSIELVVGQPRIWRLKEVPFRIQVADPTVLDVAVLGPPTELSLIGKRVGSTSLNLWFGDPNDLKNQRVLSIQAGGLPGGAGK